MFIILTLASLIAASVPILGYLFLIWKIDLYSPKPLWLMGAAFLWGALGAVLVAIFSQVTLEFPLSFLLSPELNAQMGATIVAPLTEEPAKAFILLLLIRSRSYSNTCDGFVLGAAAGLGFGMTENAKYFIEGSMQAGLFGLEFWTQLVITRTLFCAVMHATATSLVGASLGFGKFLSKPLRVVSVSVGLFLALGIHALWNGILVTDVTAGEDFLKLADLLQFEGPMEPMLIDIVLLGAELSLTISTFFAFLFWEGRQLKKSLNIEAKRGLILSQHIPYLSSYWKRRQKGWYEPEEQREEFINLATQLALRGTQSRLLNDKRSEWYKSDYKRIQLEIKSLQE
ncbi:MAG: hypothetical protein CMK59_03570 [Proteobacteria bacterium]|nr:hypothetical protein [Pseudomonadota bacterium]